MAVSPNAARAYAYLVGKGFSPSAAAGIVGNLMAESYDRLDTGAVGDSGEAAGIAQWRDSRQAAMRAHRDPTARDELERQLSFLVSELGGSEKSAGRMLRGATTLEQGVRGGLRYERPKDAQGTEYANRYAAAQRVLEDAGVSAGSPAGQAAVAAVASGVSSIGEMKAKLQAEFPQLRITSEDRTPEHNRKVGGAKGSQHLKGTAFDIGLKELPEAQRREIIERAVALGARGIGYYPGSTSAHIDMRQGPGAAWGPNKSHTSLNQTPEWFQQAAAQVRSGQNVANIAGGGVTGGGGVASAAPLPAPVEPPPPPDYAAQNIASGLDMMSGGAGDVTGQMAQVVPPDPILAPEPEQPAAMPQVAQGMEPSQGSAATLMATLLDTKRQQRAGIPPGLLDFGMV